MWPERTFFVLSPFSEQQMLRPVITGIVLFARAKTIGTKANNVYYQSVQRKTSFNSIPKIFFRDFQWIFNSGKFPNLFLFHLITTMLSIERYQSWSPNVGRNILESFKPITSKFTTDRFAASQWKAFTRFPSPPPSRGNMATDIGERVETANFEELPRAQSGELIQQNCHTFV